MAYCTKADIIKLFPEANLVELTDDESAGQVNDGRLADAIEQADNEIGAYLTRYDLPLVDPIPPVVKKLSVDITLYNLYSRRLEEIPETREKRYQNAVRLLEKINKGELDLGVSAQAEPEPRQGSVRWYAV